MPIDKTGHLTSLIRLHFAAHGAAAHNKPTSSKQTPKLSRKDQASATRDKYSTKEALNSWVAQRVAALTPDDPQRRRKVFRIFLESVLALEFGPQLIGDNDFDQLVEKVLVHMESDSELNTMMNEAALALLEAPLNTDDRAVP